MQIELANREDPIQQEKRDWVQHLAKHRSVYQFDEASPITRWIYSIVNPYLLDVARHAHRAGWASGMTAGGRITQGALNGITISES